MAQSTEPDDHDESAVQPLLSDLAVVDEDSLVERALTKYVNKPIVKRIPAWVKPNTISAVNHFACWSQLVCAFLAVHVDQTQEEYTSGQMGEGRDLWTCRFVALLLRLAMAFFNFACASLDCLDGMHARRTGQTSKLGEVMDHALDAANIPLIASAMVVGLELDKWTIAIGLLTCGTVFNSQLVVYRYTHKFIKPPTNGPEAQMLSVASAVGVGVLLYYVGRFNPYVMTTCYGVGLVASVLQINNTFYFWGFLSKRTMADHARFCALMGVWTGMYLFKHLSAMIFIVGSIFFAFRLSGMYVMFVVANRHKVEKEQKAGKPRGPALRSRFGSLYSGWDRAVALWVLVFLVVPWVISEERPIQTHGVAMRSTYTELILMAVLFVHTSYINIMDIRSCLPYLLPEELVDKPLLELIF